MFCHFVQEQGRRIRSGLTVTYSRCTTRVGVLTNRSLPDYTTVKTVQNLQLLVPSYTAWTGLYHSGSLCGSHQPSSLKYQMPGNAFISGQQEVQWKDLFGQLEITIRRIRVSRMIKTRGHQWWRQQWAAGTSGISKNLAGDFHKWTLNTIRTISGPVSHTHTHTHTWWQHFQVCSRGKKALLRVSSVILSIHYSSFSLSHFDNWNWDKLLNTIM